jgi:hypothetical protein
MEAKPGIAARGVGGMPRCAATKHDGTPCERIVGASQTYCYSHDESRAEQRSNAASAAASSKHQGSEIVQDRTRLKEIAEGCLAGTITTARASVAAQVYGVRARYFEQERRQREVEEIAREVEEIKDMLQAKRDQRSAYG